MTHFWTVGGVPSVDLHGIKLNELRHRLTVAVSIVFTSPDHETTCFEETNVPPHRVVTVLFVPDLTKIGRYVPEVLVIVYPLDLNTLRHQLL